MARHKCYASIVEADRQGSLKEPFAVKDFRAACPGLGNATYNAFLSTHAVGNPGGNTELFERVALGKFKLVRPIKYGL